MKKELAGYWWSMLIRGIVAILFAILAFARPGITLEFLVILLGVLFVLDGLFALIGAIRAAEHHKRWWLFLLEGVVGIAIGLLIFIWPDITAVVLIYFVAAWALLTGVLELAAAFSEAWGDSGQWLIATAGVLSLLLGLAIIVFPLFMVKVIIWIIGLYALVFGISLIMFALQIKSVSSNK